MAESMATAFLECVRDEVAKSNARLFSVRFCCGEESWTLKSTTDKQAAALVKGDSSNSAAEVDCILSCGPDVLLRLACGKLKPAGP